MKGIVKSSGTPSSACVYAVCCLAVTLFAPVSLRAQQSTPKQRFSYFDGPQGAFLGVVLKDVTAADVHSMKLPGVYGAIVSRVVSGSPAAKAGLEVNDVILEFGGMRVWSADQLAQLLRETPPGRTVALQVSRAGKKKNLQVTIEARREGWVTPRIEVPPIQISPPTFNFNRRFYAFFPTCDRLGVEVQTLTPQLATFFHVTQGKGVLVTEVEPGG